MGKTGWTDEYTLLCERCGYVVEGLESSGACPECGKAIAESLPGVRMGSAFQRGTGLRGLLRTVLDMHVRPRRVFREMRVVPGRDSGLTASACLVSALVTTYAVLMPAFVIAEARHSPGHVGILGRSLGLIFPGVGIVIAVAMSLVVLTVFEAIGVVFFSRRRQWRVSHGIARAVCAHAACTWWIAGFGVGIGVWFSELLGATMNPLIANTPFDWIGPMLGPVIGGTLGMLVFETLVYAGVRECRFMNRERAG